MPQVSIIIPVRNAARHIRACLDAVLSQTLRDIEVICVENGSTDASPDVITAFSRFDPRVSSVDGAALADAGAARNAGLAQVSGDWIAFVDADDLPVPDMLGAAVAAGEADNADIVVFDAVEFDDMTGFETPLPLRLDAGLGDDVRFTSFGNCVWNKLYRASYLHDCGIRFQEIARSNDLAFCIESLARTDGISVLPRVLYRYRINGGGLQSTKSCTPDCWREALAETRRRVERVGLLPRFCVALEHLESQVAGDNIPGGCLSPRRIMHSIRRRGLLNFLKHAIGRAIS